MLTSHIQFLRTLIRQSFSQVSLRTFLTVPFLLQMWLIVGLTGYLSWRNSEKAVNQLIIDLQNEVSDRIEQKLLSFIKTPKTVTEINEKEILLGDLDLKNISQLQRHIWQQIQIFDRVEFIQFGTADGNYIGISSVKNPLLKIDIKNQERNEFIYSYQLDHQGNIEKPLASSEKPYDPRIRPWYQAAIQANQPIWVDPYNSFDNQSLSLTFVRPLRNNQNQIIGVTGADVSFQEFHQFLERQKLGKSGQIFIIDRQGFLIASSTLESVVIIQDRKAIQKKAAQSGDSVMTASIEHLVKKFGEISQIEGEHQLTFIDKGEEQFLQVVPFQDEYNLNWLIVVVVPESDFMEEIYANTRTTILICFGALGVAVAIGILSSRQLTKPIIRLSQAAKELSNGNWNQTIKSHRVIELNILSNAFNQMSEELQHSYQQLEEYSHSLEQKVDERTQELKQSEQKFATAFQNTPNPIYITRLNDNTYFDVNEKFCRLTGYSYEEILGKTSFDLNLWINQKDAEHYYNTLHSQGKLRNYEVNYRKKSGEIGIALLSADLIEINGEQYLLSNSNDITERKRTEVALKLSEEKFHKAFQASPDMIGISDLETGRFIEVNDSFVQNLGYSREEFINYRSLDITFCFYPEERDLLMQQIKANKQIRNQEVTLRKKSGETLTVLLSAEIIEVGDIKRFLFVATDISDLKQAEAKLQTQNIELEIARKKADEANQAKSLFLANMSHELRTPLNAILGFSQLMAQNPIYASASKELEIINKSGEHLLSLINDILDLSKIEAGKMSLEEEEFDLYSLLDTLEAMLKIRAKTKGIQLISQHKNIPQYIKADDKKLRQVLINLIGNAIKFTDQGTVTLRVDSNISDSSSLSPNLPVQLFFMIEDTGVGISSEEIEKLFNDFVQTSAGKQSQQGTGLGLSISRRFIQLMGGDISVESQLGKGSIFKFNIQAKTTESTKNITPISEKKVIALAQNQPLYRILVVDEVPENRLLVRQILQPLGFEVYEAENGLEAIKQWEEHSPNLIWMDIQMPVMDGYEATQEIKAKPTGKNTVIIALTASALSHNEQRIFEVGCDDILYKPFHTSELLDKIATYLEVRYVYETQNTPSESFVPTVKLTLDALNVMPLDWIKKFHQAAIQGDDDNINDLITQIPESNSELAATLTSLVEDFRFDKITAVTEQLV
ncbi:MAG: PAS domain S-box protein [Cyanobacteria bacterium J06592_8]